ncbi:MAG: peptidoglycan -binding protein [Pseudomonadota bacterium]
MALVRRSGSRFEANIWPGFVDAMTALLLVLMFVLSIFMIMQFILQETIIGQQGEIDDLGQELSALADALGLEQRRNAELEDEVGTLNATLDTANNQVSEQALLIATLQRDQATAEAAIASFEEQVAGLLSRTGDLEAQLLAAREESAARAEDLRVSAEEIARLEALNAEELTRAEALRLALAQARSEINAQAEAARLAAAQREAAEALIAELQADLSDRIASLAQLATALEEQQDEVASLTANRDTLRERILALDAALADQADRAAALEEDLTAAETARDATAEELANAELARLAEQAAVERLRARLAEADTALSDSERERLAEAAAAEALRSRLSEAETALSEAERARLADLAAAEAARERLRTADTELTAMTLALEEKRKEAEETLTLLAAAEQARRTLQTARADDLSELERRRALLAQANQTLAQERAETAEARRRLALLNQQTASLRQQLASLQQTLNEAEAKDLEQEVQIEALGTRLNAALAQVAADERRRAEEAEAEARRLAEEAGDLRNFRSEFFGLMRAALSDQPGVQIVGDRFIFSSEILFAPASASLGSAGRTQISEVAAVIKDISDRIPAQIDWVLQVNGHTDRTPLSGTGTFRDNWELSQGRALSVVRYLIDQEGLPPGRLAAAGFGEYQPVDPGDSAEALARNRRIELKLTER